MRLPTSFLAQALALAPAVVLQTLLCSGTFARSWFRSNNVEGLQALEQLSADDHLERRQIVSAGGISFNTINTCLVARWGGNNDALLYRAYDNNASNTIEGCGLTCGARGFSVFGLQNGVLCLCDHFVHFNLPADPSTCTTPCSGNSNQMCGSRDSVAVYQRRDVLATPPPFTDSLGYRHTIGGCFRDIGNPPNFGLKVVAVSNTMTPSYCAVTCTSLGYVYSATRLGNTCGCTSTLPSYKYLNGLMANTDNFDQCNTPCAGNSTLVCGGPSTTFPTWGFMDSTYVGTPTYVDANGYKVVSQGCFVDSQTVRTLPSQPNLAITGSMTVNACGLACSSSGYQMFGVEYGSECYCGSLLSTANFTSSTSCNMACNGNSGQICGGAQAISIYTQTIPGTVPTLRNNYKGISYAGCYEFSPTSGTFATLNDLTAGASDVESCVDACTAAGYAFSGITLRSYRAICLCSMSATFVSQLADTACNATCATNSMELCGSIYASQTTSALTVYNNNVVSLVPAAKAQVSSYVTGGLTFAYTGCYVDNASARLFPARFDIASLTPQKCMDKCAASGYLLAGVEAGSECYCSNTPMTNSNTKWPILNGQWVAFTGTNSNYQNQQTVCIKACSGDSTLSCGGNNALQVYTAPFAVSFTGSTYRGETINYAGCYVDNSTNSPTYRAMSTNVLISNTMTIQTCVNACVAKGFAYSGLEYGVECWCQNSAPTTSTVSGNQCNMPCSGASSTMCGAGNLLSVFTVTTPSTAQVVNSFLSVTYLGCYATSTSARVLNNYRVVATNMAPGVCASTCTGLGYAYAAVGLANECTCGQQILAGASTSTACTAACQNIPSRICGGTNAVSMYSTGATGFPISSNLLASGATQTADVAAQGNVFPSAYATGNQFSSCVVDSSASRVFPFRVTNINAATVTPQSCIDACILQGFTYAGIEYGVECYCASAAPSGGAAPDCVQMPCPGNAALGCGAGNRLAVYTIGTVSQSVNTASTVGSYTSQGCIVDSISSRTLRYIQPLQFSTMTPTICINACAAKNYAYAGMEYSGECYCDVVMSTTTTSTNCKMPCAGLASAFCGGGNAINVYYNSALVRTGSIASYTAANGNVWKYKACWGEPANGRGLTRPFDNSAQFTIQSCLEAGSAAGLNACGLEYGGECWCDSISGNPGGGQIPESYCTTNGMACKGDSTRNCGASNVFAFYSTGSQSYTLT